MCSVIIPGAVQVNALLPHSEHALRVRHLVDAALQIRHQPEHICSEAGASALPVDLGERGKAHLQMTRMRSLNVFFNPTISALMRDRCVVPSSSNNVC